MSCGELVLKAELALQKLRLETFRTLCAYVYEHTGPKIKEASEETYVASDEVWAPELSPGVRRELDDSIITALRALNRQMDAWFWPEAEVDAAALVGEGFADDDEDDEDEPTSDATPNPTTV